MILPEKTGYWWDIQISNRFGAYIEGYYKIAIDLAIKTLGPVKGKRVLDYGCGSGTWSFYLQRHGFEAIGVDIDVEALKIYQGRIPSSRVIRVAALDKRIPLADESVDLIIVISLSQMFENDWFVREAGRVLKPNGILVGSLQNKISWRGFTHKVKSALQRTKNPFMISFRKFKSLTNRMGFDLVFSRGFSWIPIPSRLSDSTLFPILKTAEQFLLLGYLRTVSPNVVFVLRKSRKRKGKIGER